MPDDSQQIDNTTAQPTTVAMPKPLYKRFWHYWKPVIIVLAIILPSRSIIVDWNDVPTGSMIPTIQVGDRIFVNKLAYGLRVPFTMIWLSQWGDIEPGDVVTCKSPADGVRLVKRVMGTPGDTLELRNNVVYINDQPLATQQLDDAQRVYTYTTPKGHHRTMNQFLEIIGEHTHIVIQDTNPSSHSDSVRNRNYGPVTVPENQYFLMGDNRDFSSDSRVFEFVHRDKIFGRTRRVLLTLKLSNFFDRLWIPIP